MGTIRIASNNDSPSFNLVICTIGKDRVSIHICHKLTSKSYPIKTSAQIDKAQQRIFTKEKALPKIQQY